MSDPNAGQYVAVAAFLAEQGIGFAGINGNRVYFMVMPEHLREAVNEEAVSHPED